MRLMRLYTFAAFWWVIFISHLLFVFLLNDRRHKKTHIYASGIVARALRTLLCKCCYHLTRPPRLVSRDTDLYIVLWANDGQPQKQVLIKNGYFTKYNIWMLVRCSICAYLPWVDRWLVANFVDGFSVNEKKIIIKKYTESRTAKFKY